MKLLSGEVAFVTGANRGIGRAIALTLADAGAAVALSARAPEGLTETVRIIRDKGGLALPLGLDVTDAEERRSALAEASAALGAVSILVNNAGIAESASLSKQSDDLWDRTIAVNLIAPFALSRLVLPAMKERGHGRIINIASTASRKGYPYVAAYVASKHGLLGMTRALSKELVGFGISVNAVCPGYADTDITRGAVEKIVAASGRDSDEARADLVADSPLGRLVQPEEVAEAVLALANPANSAISGQAIGVCGGEAEGS